MDNSVESALTVHLVEMELSHLCHHTAYSRIASLLPSRLVSASQSSEDYRYTAPYPVSYVGPEDWSQAYKEVFLSAELLPPECVLVLGIEVDFTNASR